MNVKKGYWNEEFIVENCRKWQAATTEIKYQRIYNEIVPSFNRMCQIIRQRYFNFRQDEYSDLMTKCITACFMSIPNYNFKYKSFSYFQTVIKNTLLEIVRTKNMFDKRNVRTIDNDELGDSNAILIDNNIDYVDTKKHLIDILTSTKGLSKRNQIIRDEMIIFIKNYEMRHIKDMVLYLNKLGYKRNHIKNSILHIFGINYYFNLVEYENYDYEYISIDDYYNYNKIKIKPLKNKHIELKTKNKYIQKYKN